MGSAASYSEPAAAVSAYLELAGAEKSAVFPLHDEAVIGRDPQDSLALDRFVCIPEHTVSRRHARIRRRGDTYYVEDLHSFNGTFLLGNRLPPGAWYPLKDGDELTVASTPIVFHSLLVPARASVPTFITKSIDATQYASNLEPPPSADQQDLKRAVQKLHAMAQVSIALGAVKDRGAMIEKIMNFIFELFPLAERAFIMLKQNEGEAPVPVAARRRDGQVEDAQQIRMSRTIIREVFEKKQSILSVDTLADRHFGTQESIIAQAIRSVMCVPLLVEGECLGLIQVDTSSDPYAFKEQDLEMLTGVCAETAVALKNFQLYSDIERLLDGFVRASVQAIEERDPATAGHSFRVAAYAENLARAADHAVDPDLRKVAFSRDQMREIRYAALLHDFGKVGVREHVLCKEKKLHPSAMRMLEQRFKYARACLERQAYRRLLDLQADRSLSAEAFQQERMQMEAGLRAEFERLDHFLATIHRANEPTVSHAEDMPELKDVLAYHCSETGLADAIRLAADDPVLHLLEEGEFAALSVSKGCLTAEERLQIQEHVVDSYSFLILIPWTRDLAGVPAIAHGHHEKLDGSGYPMGLHAPQISIQTRILTICDIYDALTAGDRPYKKAVPVPQALDMMYQECREGRLDTRLFDVFVESKSWAAA